MDRNEKVESRRRFIINFVYFLIFAGIVFLTLRYLTAWMMPFILAFVVAVLLQKPVKWLVKLTKGGKKFFSVALVVAMVLLLAGLVLLVGWRLVVWITNFVSDPSTVQTMRSSVTAVVEAIQQALVKVSNSMSEEAVESLMSAINTVAERLISVLSGLFASITSWALNITKRLPMGIVSFIFWIVASVFCTIDYDNIIGFFARQLPEKTRNLIVVTKDYGVNTVFKVLRAYLLLMLITFVELSIGFTILGVKNSILVGAVVAIIDILPVLGTGAVLIPWSVLSLILGDYKMFIGLGVMYIIITVVRNILEPRFVSEQIGLNPLVTLFFMFLGLQSVGVLGMFAFPIIVMVLKKLQDAGYVRLWK